MSYDQTKRKIDQTTQRLNVLENNIDKVDFEVKALEKDKKISKYLILFSVWKSCNSIEFQDY